ncbi:MAG: efflux RND transporter periplasmic adaptor subunit [Polyangiaceae bacterium]|nr:efflux RND transporter periplasmic adaptor subunit [Polyangiaceae bacterium]
MAVLKTILRLFIPIFIITLGIWVRSALIAMKPEAEVVDQEQLGVLVETIPAALSEQAVQVDAEGVVVASQQVTIQSEVSGRVRSRSPDLVPGGRFRKGDSLLKIDAGEYKLRAAQSASEVEQARQMLALEKSRGEIARQEWELIGEHENASQAGRDTALRIPYQKEAQARLVAAQQQKKLAGLNLTRTEIRAPFNGFVQSGQVDVGQLVAPGSPLVTLVGSDSFWVQVSIPMESLTALEVPGLNTADDEGSATLIWQTVGDEKVEREGRVVGLLGDLDPIGRLARILVKIDDPLGLNLPEAERGIPLLLGSFVHVQLDAETLESVIELPRKAVHAGRYVHVLGPEGLLEIRDVDIAWKTPSSYLIRKGISPGDQIIVSRMGRAVEGMKLRNASSSPDSTALQKSKAQIVGLKVDQRESQATGARE